MASYILRRLLLIPFTLFGIILVAFVVVQFAPGGPIEQLLAESADLAVSGTDRFSGTTAGEMASGKTSLGQHPGGSAGETSGYLGAQGLDPARLAALEAQFHFDKPPVQRFFIMLADFARFDLGDSFFRGKPVIDLILEKLPVSVSLGLWSTLIIYLVSIPLGIAKAVRDGSRFDVITSWIVSIGYAVPGFVFAIALVVLFAGGNYLEWFPAQHLTSAGWEDFTVWEKIKDYAWHVTLPVLAMVVGGFASLTLLTKNSFLEEIHKQYVVTARSKGLSETRILWTHVFRNAMLLVIAGFPVALVSILFTGSLLIETIFNLDGLGLLSVEAIWRRDYPIVFGSLYIFALIGLVLTLVSDLTYHLVDPRIDFESRT
ncbi:microcin C ABC transporter permease YejB [Phaeovibrio sulfidiphilus]|uniref:Microcin C ABC transporter permease YejB n=1 Tax=Phaeovibrio sulfidiphilus TaxID=1220600 RepID=A0A8J7CP31_9PROT|nr:microcin C ABC transporter permease YejB [Phaeovibrio sulfidiphilus]MBE1236557.1 microcin C ABC transporter permease YejB [Phaeovibrio sulfidiphilus]